MRELLLLLSAPGAPPRLPQRRTFLYTDQDYIDPPWHHDLSSANWHAMRGTLPGRWDTRAITSPPPAASPPPWWAVGVGGDEEYDWNLRERDWEYSGLESDALHVRDIVRGISFSAANLFFDATEVVHLLDCTVRACRERGINGDVPWRGQIREPWKLQLGIGEGNDPSSGQRYIPGSLTVDQARDPGGTVRREMSVGKNDEDNPNGFESSKRTRELEREQLGLVFLPPKDHAQPWQEGADTCEDNDEIVRLAFAGASEISDCATLLKAALRYGVACEADLRPFGIRLDTIATACPKACGACRRDVSARAAADSRWHQIGAISRFYADTAEYLLYLETAFLKLLVYCDMLDGVRCDRWQMAEAPGADTEYDRIAHFFVGRAKHASLDNGPAAEFVSAGEAPPPPPPPADSMAQLTADADEGSRLLTLDDVAPLVVGSTLHVGVYAAVDGVGAEAFGAGGGLGGEGYRTGYGSEDVVVQSVVYTANKVMLETPTAFAHEVGDLVASTPPRNKSAARAAARKRGFYAMLRPRNASDRPNWGEDAPRTRLFLKPAALGKDWRARAALAASLNRTELTARELAELTNASRGTLVNVSCDLVLPWCAAHRDRPCPCDPYLAGTPQPERVRLRDDVDLLSRETNLTLQLQQSAPSPPPAEAARLREAAALAADRPIWDVRPEDNSANGSASIARAAEAPAETRPPPSSPVAGKLSGLWARERAHAARRRAPAGPDRGGTAERDAMPTTRLRSP